MSIALAAGAYFSIVFAIGFALGVLRTVWVAPWLGERAAELVEFPLMVAASYFAARLVIARSGRGLERGEAALVGAAALALLLGAELGVVLFVRRQTLGDYFASRDPIAGTAYVVALLLYAAMPLLVVRARRANPR